MIPTSQFYDMGQPAMNRPHKLQLALSPGNLPLLLTLVVLAMAGGLVFGISLLFTHPEVAGGPICTITSLAVMMPTILLFPVPGAVYDNGIAVPHRFIERMMGRRTFFPYEEIDALYPAMFESAAHHYRVRGPDEWVPGSINRPGRSMGVMTGEMISDPGFRWGVGVETPQGPRVLWYSKTTERDNVQPYQQIMYYVRYYMDQKGLSLVKRPLKLSEAEVQELVQRAEPPSLRFIIVGAMLSTTLPLALVVILAAIFKLMNVNLGVWTLPVLLLIFMTFILGFVVMYQSRTSRYIRATNRLNYYKASQMGDFFG